MRYSSYILYLFVLSHFEYLCCSAEKLTKEEFSAFLPKRHKVAENHFPSQPQLPNSSVTQDIFVLVTNGDDLHDKEIMAKDVLGLPLGSQEGDFSKFTSAQDEYNGGDDAIIIEAGGMLYISYFCWISFKA